MKKLALIALFALMVAPAFGEDTVADNNIPPDWASAEVVLTIGDFCEVAWSTEAPGVSVFNGTGTDSVKKFDMVIQPGFESKDNEDVNVKSTFTYDLNIELVNALLSDDVSWVLSDENPTGLAGGDATDNDGENWGITLTLSEVDYVDVAAFKALGTDALDDMSVKATVSTH